MILCIGEILVDMIGKEENGQISYDVFAGGAPFNVACGIANLGGKAAFIGNVGNDMMGHFLADFAQKRNLHKVLISVDNRHNTTLAFVRNDENGERYFSFYRKDTADYYLNEDYLKEIRNAKIVHLGSLMLSNETGRDMADRIVSETKKEGKLLSFDVNFRSDLYESEEAALEIYQKYAKEADIIKYSLDELYLFAKEYDIYKALGKIAINDQLVFLTLGKDGSVFYCNGTAVKSDSIKVKAIDATGAGDAFYAAVLTKLDELDISQFVKDKDMIKEVLSFANISGALSTTKKGAINALPALEEIHAYMK